MNTQEIHLTLADNFPQYRLWPEWVERDAERAFAMQNCVLLANQIEIGHVFCRKNDSISRVAGIISRNEDKSVTIQAGDEDGSYCLSGDSSKRKAHMLFSGGLSLPERLTLRRSSENISVSVWFFARDVMQGKNGVNFVISVPAWVEV